MSKFAVVTLVLILLASVVSASSPPAKDYRGIAVTDELNPPALTTPIPPPVPVCEGFFTQLFISLFDKVNPNQEPDRRLIRLQ